MQSSVHSLIAERQKANAYHYLSQHAGQGSNFTATVRSRLIWEGQWGQIYTIDSAEKRLG